MGHRALSKEPAGLVRGRLPPAPFNRGPRAYYRTSFFENSRPKEISFFKDSFPRIRAQGLVFEADLQSTPGRAARRWPRRQGPAHRRGGGAGARRFRALSRPERPEGGLDLVSRLKGSYRRAPARRSVSRSRFRAVGERTLSPGWGCLIVGIATFYQCPLCQGSDVRLL
jgi:hypothetical protein